MEASSAYEIWEAALGELQIQVNKQNYRTWLEQTRGVSYKDNQFIISVPNTFIAEYLDKNQRCLIEKTLIGIIHHEVEVLFSVNGIHKKTVDSRIAQEPSSHFNEKYTFDRFIVGDCNRLAHAAALGIAESPGHSYNPLFLYGGVGLGKTHLLQAIGYMAQAKHIQVLCVSGEQFTNDFVSAIRVNKAEEFRKRYRCPDMLLIDDIHFISGKEQTEGCLFHTFNELHNTNRQIVVTSDRPPQSLSLIEDRLRSRFEWGLIADLQPPDFETRLAILQCRTARAGVNITPAVLETIAQRNQQNMRELEGNLNRVIAYTKLIGTTLTPELAVKALEDIAPKITRGDNQTATLITEAVANSFKITLFDLKSRKRDKETALARQVAMYLLKQETHHSMTEIGKMLGGRNPSTVSHAYEKVTNGISSSPYLNRRISNIQRSIKN